MEWKGRQNGCACRVELLRTLYLSYATVLQLELLFNARTQSAKQSVFAALNRTHVSPSPPPHAQTVAGKRLLRAFLLAPSSDRVREPHLLHA